MKITEHTLIPISLIIVLLSGAWAASKLDSKVEKHDEYFEKLEKRILNLELRCKGHDDFCFKK